MKMQNEVYLAGTLVNVEPSHTYGNTQYLKAILCVIETNIRIPVVFTEREIQDNQFVSIFGNLRSHTVDGKTDLYVFTDFVIQEDTEDCVFLDGNICKISDIRTDKLGNEFRTFVLANNQYPNGRKVNNYIPCIVYSNAEGYKDLSLKDTIHISGFLTSKGKWCEVAVDEFSVLNPNHSHRRY